MPLRIQTGPTAGDTGAVGFVAGQRQYQDQQRSIERQLRQNELQTTLGGMQSLQGFMQPFVQNAIAKQTAQWQSDMAMKETKKKFDWLTSEEYADANARARVFNEQAGHRESQGFWQKASAELRSKGPAASGVANGHGLSLKYGGGDGTLTEQQLKGGLAQISQRLERIGGVSANAGLTDVQKLQAGLTSVNGQTVHVGEGGRVTQINDQHADNYLKLVATGAAHQRLVADSNMKSKTTAHAKALEKAMAANITDEDELRKILDIAVNTAPQQQISPQWQAIFDQMTPFLKKQMGLPPDSLPPPPPDFAGEGAGEGAGERRIPLPPEQMFHSGTQQPHREPSHRELFDLAAGDPGTNQGVFRQLAKDPEQDNRRLMREEEDRRNWTADPENRKASKKMRSNFEDPSWGRVVGLIGNTEFAGLSSTRFTLSDAEGEGSRPSVKSSDTIGPEQAQSVLAYIRQVNEEERGIQGDAPVVGGGYSVGPTRLSAQKLLLREVAIEWLLKNAQHVLLSLDRHRSNGGKGLPVLGKGTDHEGELIPFPSSWAGKQLEEMFGPRF